MIEFGMGVFSASMVWFFVWRNNKKKFMNTLGAIEWVVNNYGPDAKRLAERVLAVITEKKPNK